VADAVEDADVQEAVVERVVVRVAADVVRRLEQGADDEVLRRQHGPGARGPG
jgi:hypothetical protein